jgi:hypothetical protein
MLASEPDGVECPAVALGRRTFSSLAGQSASFDSASQSGEILLGLSCRALWIRTLLSPLADDLPKRFTNHNAGQSALRLEPKARRQEPLPPAAQITGVFRHQSFTDANYALLCGCVCCDWPRASHKHQHRRSPCIIEQAAPETRRYY